MNTALIIIAVVAFAIFLGVAVRTLLRPQPPIDIENAEPTFNLRAFRNLVSSEEDAYIRSRVTPAQYRRLQRKKFRVALVYLQELSQYAAAMARLGQAARNSANPEVAGAADALVATAFRLRLIAVFVRVDLRLRLWLPAGVLSLATLVQHYETVQDAAARLGLARYRFANLQVLR